MSNKSFKVLLLAIMALLATMSLGEQRSLNATVVYCADEVGVSDTDTQCGSLTEKMADDYGISFGAITPDTDQTLSVNFAPTELEDVSWWDGSSDFTWTFNALGDSNHDPKFEFHNYLTEHYGKFEVYATADPGENTFASTASQSNATLGQGEFVTSLIGHHILSPTIAVAGDGHVVAGYGLYIENIKSSGMWSNWGIRQVGTDDINWLSGKTAVGNITPYGNDNVTLYVNNDYSTDKSNKAGEFVCNQNTGSSYDKYPTSINGRFSL